MTGSRSWSGASFFMKTPVYRLTIHDNGRFLEVARQLVCNLLNESFLVKFGSYL